MLYYVYFSDLGVPRAGLSPVWQSLATAETGASKLSTAPAIEEIGGGWYRFSIRFGSAPWDVKTEDLVGVIDGGDELGDGDRYKAVCISLRGLGLAALVHRGEYDKISGALRVFATDGQSGELRLAMTETSELQKREPGAGQS